VQGFRKGTIETNIDGRFSAEFTQTTGFEPATETAATTCRQALATKDLRLAHLGAADLRHNSSPVFAN
jgi:hypothetical protein